MKRLFKIVYDNRKQILTIKDMVFYGRDAGLQDVKKCLDAIFIIEGLGFITRVSKNKFIFSGFKGMANRLIEGILNRVKKGQLYNRENWMFSEEVIVEKEKKQSIRNSVYLGLFYQEMLVSIFSNQMKTLSREQIEKLLEQVQQGKENSVFNILNEMLSVMTCMNLLEKRNPMDTKTELFEVYQWNGPEIFNNKGFLLESQIYSLGLKEQLYTRVDVNTQKEKNYYQTIFKDWGPDALGEIKQQQNNTQQQKYGEFDVSMIPKQNISHFPKLSFAMLRGKNWTFVVQKLVTIIGRANPPAYGKKRRYKWEVDVEIDSSNRVSKQHALIIYNFDSRCFEIRCLSTKKGVTVDQNTIQYGDPAIPLENRSTIQIGKDSFMFFLPKMEGENQNDQPLVSSRQMEQE